MPTNPPHIEQGAERALIERLEREATPSIFCKANETTRDLLTEAAEKIRGQEAELERVLVALYPSCSLAVARLCDEDLDRSGALLGRVREKARIAELEERG